jgi:hypothetical protein
VIDDRNFSAGGVKANRKANNFWRCHCLRLRQQTENGIILVEEGSSYKRKMVAKLKLILTLMPAAASQHRRLGN